MALLLIGINNPEPQVAARRLGRLLDWMAAEMPGTQPLVLAPLPQLWARGHHEALAAAYRPLLAARGVPMSTCGQSLNPASPRAYQDGLHLAAPAYRALFHCLKPLLTRLRDEQAAKRAQQQQEGAGIAPGGAGLEPAAAPAPAPALADPAAPEGRLQAGD